MICRSWVVDGQSECYCWMMMMMVMMMNRKTEDCLVERLSWVVTS